MSLPTQIQLSTDYPSGLYYVKPEELVRRTQKEFGHVLSCEKAFVKGNPREVAFLQFAHQKDARTAVRELRKGLLIQTHPLRRDLILYGEWKPPYVEYAYIRPAEGYKEEPYPNHSKSYRPQQDDVQKNQKQERQETERKKRRKRKRREGRDPQRGHKTETNQSDPHGKRARSTKSTKSVKTEDVNADTGTGDRHVRRRKVRRKTRRDRDEPSSKVGQRRTQDSYDSYDSDINESVEPVAVDPYCEVEDQVDMKEEVGMKEEVDMNDTVDMNDMEDAYDTHDTYDDDIGSLSSCGDEDQGFHGYHRDPNNPYSSDENSDESDGEEERIYEGYEPSDASDADDSLTHDAQPQPPCIVEVLPQRRSPPNVRACNAQDHAQAPQAPTRRKRRRRRRRRQLCAERLPDLDEMSWYAEEYYEYIDSFRGLNAREIMARLKEEQEAAEAAEALKKAALERVRRLYGGRWVS